MFILLIIVGLFFY
ncbi:MAG: hypothetical protein LKI94_06090 [Sporolactobacillus sp.]|nr:hypothetical protein [Sporolactobacillus sp.]MCI1881743.1 hypothetical protein [Sporolactobacillus sp.]